MDGAQYKLLIINIIIIIIIIIIITSEIKAIILNLKLCIARGER